MSFITKLFGGGGAAGGKGARGAATPTPQDAIQQLRGVEEMMSKKQDFLSKKIEAELEIIKKNGTKNKRVSLAALKRKKRYEEQLAKIDGSLTTIEYQRDALENASTNAEVLKIMGYAAKALKTAHNDMDIDKVADLMDEVKDQQTLADEISNVISNPIGLGPVMDDDELLAELEDIKQGQLDEEMLKIPAASVLLPEVPTGEPAAAAAVPVAGGSGATKAGKTKSKQDLELEAELAELAQWAEWKDMANKPRLE